MLSPSQKTIKRIKEGYSSPSHALRQLQLQQQCKMSAVEAKVKQSPISILSNQKSSELCQSQLKAGFHTNSHLLSPPMKPQHAGEGLKKIVGKNQGQAAVSQRPANTPSRTQPKSPLRRNKGVLKGVTVAVQAHHRIGIQGAASALLANTHHDVLQPPQQSEPGEDSQDLTGFEEEEEEGSPSIFGGRVSAKKAQAALTSAASSLPSSSKSADVWEDSSDE
jgi:hypothetical protein